LRSNLFKISIHPYGTRVFQRLLDILANNYQTVETPVLNEILKELIEKNLYDLVLDTNGNHVLQKIMIMYPKGKNQFIYEEICKFCCDIARLKQGGSIFQRALDYAHMNQKKMLTMEILKHIKLLINDEYGNFIIQQIMQLKISDFNEQVVAFIKQNFLNLAKNKFSSNVIDRVS
jgi:hypothetical protein